MLFRSRLDVTRANKKRIYQYIKSLLSNMLYLLLAFDTSLRGYRHHDAQSHFGACQRRGRGMMTRTHATSVEQ